MIIDSSWISCRMLVIGSVDLIPLSSPRRSERHSYCETNMLPTVFKILTKMCPLRMLPQSKTKNQCLSIVVTTHFGMGGTGNIENVSREGEGSCAYILTRTKTSTAVRVRWNTTRSGGSGNSERLLINPLQMNPK